jgi:hypothetical protein
METPRFLRNVRADRVAYYGLIGLLVVIIGSYATWRLIEYISPQQTSSGGGTTVVLSVADHSLNSSNKQVCLPNSLTDTTPPDYVNSGVTALPQSGSNFSLCRLQGTVEYK